MTSVASSSRSPAPVAGGAAPGKKRKVSNKSQLVSQVLAMAKEHEAKGGVPKETVEREFAKVGCSVEDTLGVLNEALARNKVVVHCNIHGSMLFRLQTAEELKDAAKLQGLTAEERLVYQEIGNAKEAGASTKDLRSKTSLPAPALTKALKQLETRKLVKQVKSVSAKNKKIYMLFELEPGKEITGGTWYSDQQEFDHELIQQLREAAMLYIGKHQQVTLAAVHDFISGSGLLNGKPLEQSDIESVLDMLVSDAKIESDKQLTAARSERGGVIEEKLYRMRPAFWFIDHEVRSYTTVPSCRCLVCMGQATDPTRCCPAMTAWLERSYAMGAN